MAHKWTDEIADGASGTVQVEDVDSFWGSWTLALVWSPICLRHRPFFVLGLYLLCLEAFLTSYDTQLRGTNLIGDLKLGPMLNGLAFFYNISL